MGRLSVLIFEIVTFMSLTQGRLISLKQYSAGITRIHNYYRVMERAADMQMMVWDKTLEARAAEWSENCYWGHQKRGLGENLAYQWSSGPLTRSDVIIKAIQGWYNEKFIWRWSTQCGAACHYTQMVWSRTTKIGCAYSVCNTMRTPSGSSVRNAHYFVCFYNPPGNYFGQYPYWYGNRCTKCGQTDICRKGLCCSEERANYTNYLPTGSSVMDNLSSTNDDIDDVTDMKPRIFDANKLQVSITVKYDGQKLNAGHISKKYEPLIRNEVLSHLRNRPVAYVDD